MAEGNSQLQGFSPVPGDTNRWHPIGASQLPDGSWAIKCDTELVLDAANVSISNIKVGSINQTVSGSRWIKTLDDGTLVTVSGTTNPLDGFSGARSQNIGAFPHFFGFVDTVENWIIVRQSRTGTEDTFEYVSGIGNFVINWGSRATLPYNEYFDEF